MKTWAALLAAVAVLPLLAGCSDDAAPPPRPITSEVGAAQLANGTYYAFAHRGGDLDLSVAGNGSAEVVLYGADDQRIGHIGVGAEQARGRFVLEGLDGGELVLHVLSINGTLDLRSRGEPVGSYRLLTLHVERHLLVERDAPAPLFGLPGGGSSVDETLDLDLLRAPTDVVAVARGTYESIDVRASGRSGTVYDGQGGQGVPLQAGAFLEELSGEFHDENVRDGHLSVRVQATGFSGIVFLEARSFSRARIAEGEAFVSTDVPRFTYGDLPDQPVEFEVREGTALLYLWQEDAPTADGESEGCQEPANAQQERCATGSPAYVALFGPDDARVATLAVPANATLAIPAPEAGTWVAVLLEGAATLGADRVPGDFELRLLDVVETVVPGEPAGQDDGGYGEDRRPLQAAGVPFRLDPTTIDGSGTTGMPFDPTAQVFLGGCDPTSVSILLDGETLAAWGYDGHRYTPDPQPIEGTLLLGDGELEVAYSDFGRGCSRAGVLVQGYER